LFGRIGVAHVGARGFDRGHHRGASRGTENRRSSSLSAPGFAIGPPFITAKRQMLEWSGLVGFGGPSRLRCYLRRWCLLR
jgi:hypothetical protein